MTINLKTLRSKWSKELASLSSRKKPSKIQESRKVDLQSFLAFIDPLRRLEYDWGSIKGFKPKLEAELKLQEDSLKKENRNSLYAKVLIAMTGKGLGNPSDPCVLNHQAKVACGDHGEDPDNVISEMIELYIIRLDRSNNLYSLSTIGANLMENESLKKLKSGKPHNGSQLLDALNHESSIKIAELRNTLSAKKSGDGIRSIGTVSSLKANKIKLPDQYIPTKKQNPVFSQQSLISNKKTAKLNSEFMNKLNDFDNPYNSDHPKLIILYGIQKNYLTGLKELIKQPASNKKGLERDAIFTISINELDSSPISGYGNNIRAAKEAAYGAMVRMLIKRYLPKNVHSTPDET